MTSERFTVHDPSAKALQWPVPVAVGRPDAAAHSDMILLDRAGAEIDGGRCGETIKLNLGDVGYYRVQYDPAMLARLIRSMATLAPADRVNLIADSWAMVEAGRAAPTAFFDLVGAAAGDDERAVLDQVLRVLGRVDHLERGRPGRDAFRAWARAVVRPAFARVGWDAAAGEDGDRPLLRTRLIRALGDFGDAEIIGEARRRFAAFLAAPASVPPALRDPVMHLAGRTADRATYDTLLTLSRQAASTEERMRYYYALAAARDPQLAEATLRFALTDELPTTAVSGLISSVAYSGEHADLALGFVLINFSALVDRLGPSFRNTFVSSLMMAFADREHAAQLDAFAPAHETPGGRMIAARAVESILLDMDFCAEKLPAIDAWIAQHPQGH
jgi:aminopeptidase N